MTGCPSNPLSAEQLQQGLASEAFQMLAHPCPHPCQMQHWPPPPAAAPNSTAAARQRAWWQAARHGRLLLPGLALSTSWPGHVQWPCVIRYRRNRHATPQTASMGTEGELVPATKQLLALNPQRLMPWQGSQGALCHVPAVQHQACRTHTHTHIQPRGADTWPSRCRRSELLHNQTDPSTSQLPPQGPWAA